MKLVVAIDRLRATHGCELYTQLLRRLTKRGCRQAFAGTTQPNDLHRSFGFQDAGVYRRVAWKHDSRHDVAWVQLDLFGSGGPLARSSDPPATRGPACR